jgi:hypothetical protein
MCNLYGVTNTKPLYLAPWMSSPWVSPVDSEWYIGTCTQCGQEYMTRDEGLCTFCYIKGADELYSETTVAMAMVEEDVPVRRRAGKSPNKSEQRKFSDGLKYRSRITSWKDTTRARKQWARHMA